MTTSLHFSVSKPRPTASAHLVRGEQMSIVAQSTGSVPLVITIPSTGDMSLVPINIPAFDSNQGTLNSVLVIEGLTVTNSGTAFGEATTETGVIFPTDLNITGGPSVLDGTPVLTLTDGINLAVTTSQEPFELAPLSRQVGPHTYTTALSSWEVQGGGSLGGTVSTTTTVPSILGFSITLNPPILVYTLGVTYSYSYAGTGRPIAGVELGSGATLAVSAIAVRPIGSVHTELGSELTIRGVTAMPDAQMVLLTDDRTNTERCVTVPRDHRAIRVPYEVRRIMV